MWWSPSITASASSASTIHALNDLVFLELLSGHTTDASAVEVGLLGLDASEAAELLVTLLLPLCDQVLVGIVVLQQPFVQLF